MVRALCSCIKSYGFGLVTALLLLTSSFYLQFSSLLVFFTDIWPPGLFMSLKRIIIIIIIIIIITHTPFYYILYFIFYFFIFIFLSFCAKFHCMYCILLDML